MKCQKCGQESYTTSTNCPFCNENYSLSSVLSWVISEQGDFVLNDARTLKANVLDLCRDTKYDKIVFEGLLSQGFAKKLAELSKLNNFEETLEAYCKTLATTYNIDKINYIADAFYYALTGKNRIQKKVVYASVNTTKSNPNINTYAPPATKSPTSAVQGLLSEILSKIQSFDFQKFFSKINVQSIKTILQKNKKLSVCAAGVLALVIVISVISSVVGNISEKKAENTLPYDSSYENDDYYDEYEEDNTEDVYTPSYDYLTEDTVSDIVQQGSIKEYYMKADRPGVYRFTAINRTANYNVYIKAYDFNDNRVLSITNEGSCTLESGSTYKITVETDSPSCSYTLNINRPNELKTLSKEITDIHDSITYIDQCNVYTFSAPVSGRYRVDCLNRTDGYNLGIEIYNSNNERVFRETNGGYLDMQQDVVYSIRVAYSTGFCEYDVKVSIPDAVKEITAEETAISDSLTFANQINTYTYTAPISGKYRFETIDRTNGYNVQLRIYDANNNRIVRETNNGTVNMEKDVKYRIEIEYDTELCSYILAIGVPNGIKTISAGEVISDSISYVHQENRYTFTPSSSGEYTVKASNRTNDYNVQLYVFDANNNRVLREYNEGKVSLTAGTLYTVYVCYIDNFCDYNIAVNHYYGE